MRARGLRWLIYFQILWCSGWAIFCALFHFWLLLVIMLICLAITLFKQLPKQRELEEGAKELARLIQEREQKLFDERLDK